MNKHGKICENDEAFWTNALGGTRTWSKFKYARLSETVSFHWRNPKPGQIPEFVAKYEDFVANQEQFVANSGKSHDLHLLPLEDDELHERISSFFRKRPQIKNKCIIRILVSCTSKIKPQFTLKHHALLKSKKIKNDIKTSNTYIFMNNAPFHLIFCSESSPIKYLHKYNNEFKN